MAANPLQLLSKYTEFFGDTFHFYLRGLKEAIVTTDPAVIQHVLKINAENYQKSDIQVKRMGRFLGKCLLTTHGDRRPWIEHWIRHHLQRWRQFGCRQRFVPVLFQPGCASCAHNGKAHTEIDK
jgi:hypothetical protein